jgi:hypothetical protein
MNAPPEAGEATGLAAAEKTKQSFAKDGARWTVWHCLPRVGRFSPA